MRVPTVLARKWRALEQWSWVPWLMIIVASAWAARSALDNAPPGRFVPGTVNAELISPALVVSYKFERRRLCDAYISRSIVDPLGRVEHLVPVSYSANMIAELQTHFADRVSLVLPRPVAIVPGTYRLQVSIEYSCNWVQQFVPIKVSFSVPFQLMKDTP